MKEFDAVANKGQTELNIAACVGKMVGSMYSQVEDWDDASEEAGKLVAAWFKEMAYNKDFIRTVENIIGDRNFNSEFFLDGIMEGT